MSHPDPTIEAYEDNEAERGGLLGELERSIAEHKRLTTTADGIVELLGIKKPEVW